jgi:NAD(P)H dehydrogenase (quinone)
MHVLVVLDHPQPASFSAAIAESVRRGALAAGHTFELADLAAEGFDGAMTTADLEHFRGRGPAPEDVLREQRRVDAADALIIVFPIYWWSLPARLKGWIDRVFTNGWAYADGTNGAVEGGLRDRPVHLLGVGATDEEAFERHGYAQAMETQIPYGIFNYCGLTNVKLHRLLESDAATPAPRTAHLETAFALGRSL